MSCYLFNNNKKYIVYNNKIVYSKMEPNDNKSNT